MADEKSNGAGTEAEPKKPTCFVVSPIGAAGSPERKHANVTLKFIIEPVLERCGFQKHADGRHALRADTLGEVGIISRQIISQLLTADLVIADLTGRNPNVFYELAIRHGTGRPFVQLMAKGEILPFDVGHQRTIFFDRTDLDDVEDCKAELERQVKSVMASQGPIETPIGQTLDYERLRSGGEIGQALANLADQVTQIRREQGWVANEPILHSSGNTISPGLNVMILDAARRAWMQTGMKGRPSGLVISALRDFAVGHYAYDEPDEPEMRAELLDMAIEMIRDFTKGLEPAAKLP